MARRCDGGRFVRGGYLSVVSQCQVWGSLAGENLRMFTSAHSPQRNEVWCRTHSAGRTVPEALCRIMSKIVMILW